MSTKKIHDGKMVAKRIEELEGMDTIEFGEQMGITGRSVYLWLKKTSWKTIHLYNAGKVLECDFFSYYTPEQSVKLRSSEVTQSEDGTIKARIELDINLNQGN